jgi:ankyrin repeat protein
MFAVSRRGDIGIRLIDLLVSRGADVTRVDRDGLNVLHVAIESTDAFNERAALHLIENYNDIDLNAPARSEETPLKICARVGDLTEMVVRALLNNSQVEVDSIGDEEYPESRRRTALHIATEAGSVKIMELLLQADVKVNVKDINVSEYG